MITHTQFQQRLAWLEHRIRPHEAVLPDALSLMQQAGITPDPWQAQVVQTPTPRLLLNCCRQSGKSSLAAALALATALHEPGSLTLVLSPSLRQSQESFRKVLDLYQPIASAWPAQAESALRLELATGSRIVSLPGLEGTVRGYSGVRLLIVDEAARVDDALYFAIRPMLAVSGGSLVALSTPFGRRGWWHHEWTAGQGWQRVCITAAECPRISAAFLAEERRTLPRLWYQSEYECQFVETVSQVFAFADIQAALRGSIVPFTDRR